MTALKELDVDLSVFKELSGNDQCGGSTMNDCPAEQRIGALMAYYHKQMDSASDSVSARQFVIDFCDSVYPKATALSDYIDFTRFHRGATSLRRFTARWRLQCAGVGLCGFAGRHLRERGVDARQSAETRPVRHATVDRLDALHCTALHLAELGLRANDENNTDTKKSTSENEKTFNVARFDGSKNNKFNIAAAATASEERDGRTYLDALGEELRGVCAVDEAEAAFALNVEELIYSHAFDTDSLKIDVELFEDDGDCNLWRAAEGSVSLWARMSRFFRRMRITSQCFSTGFLFWYWPFYGTADAERSNTENKYRFIDFGGFSVRETFVRPHFGSFKEELLGSQLIDVAAFREDIVEKGDGYAESKLCREMKSDGLMGCDAYHFDIADGSALRPHHLYALIAYCDFTDFCTAFSETFREMRFHEGVASVARRNSRFAFCSRYLREAVAYYGCKGHEHEAMATNGSQNGPFFTGMSVVLNLPQFQIAFQGLSLFYNLLCISLSVQDRLRRRNRARSRGALQVLAEWSLNSTTATATANSIRFGTRRG